VSSGGSYSTGQLTWVAAGASSLTVTQKPTSGASTSKTVSSTSNAPTLVLAAGGALTVKGIVGATIHVDTNAGSADATLTSPVQIVSVPAQATQALGRYVSSDGRYGPLGTALL